jgi:hypothetical protein
MTDLERFTQAMAVMMGYCKYAPLNEDDDCSFHDEYICETNKLCSKVGWFLITPEGELTPEVRKWWIKNLERPYREYLRSLELSDAIFTQEAQLSWRNLWKWMRENTEWNEQECPVCWGEGFYETGESPVIENKCPECNGTGRVARWDVEKWLEGK